MIQGGLKAKEWKNDWKIWILFSKKLMVMKVAQHGQENELIRYSKRWISGTLLKNPNAKIQIMYCAVVLCPVTRSYMWKALIRWEMDASYWVKCVWRWRMMLWFIHTTPVRACTLFLFGVFYKLNQFTNWLVILFNS